MQLVAPLAAGMAGCESGHAEVFERGSGSTRSGYYTNAEGTGGTSTDDVTLDANGRANIYVNEHVDVACYDSGGSLVTTFTVMGADRNVEVISQSFTGQAYAGGGSAASLPVDLQTVLDLWYDSAGALDFQVDLEGTATNLDTALAGIYGHVFNVKAYGAVGDGATDDRTAILAAKSAADTYGGSVFFPEGTYIFGSSISWTDTPMIGVPGRSKMKSDSTSDIIDFLGSTESASAVYGMEFDCGVTVSDDTLDYEITFTKCRFAPSDSAHANNDALAFGSGSSTNNLYVNLIDCYFTNLTDRLCIDFLGHDDGRLSVVNCRFVGAATFTTSGPLNFLSTGSAGAVINGCTFDMSPITSATGGLNVVNVRGPVSAVGNEFVESASVGAICFKLGTLSSGDKFFESGNVFPPDQGTSGSTYPYSYNATGMTLGSTDDVAVHLGSRENRFIYDSGVGTSSISFQAQCRTYYLNKTSGSSLTIILDANPPPPGHRFTLIVHNATGAGVTLALSGVDKGNNSSHTLANGNTTIYYVEYVAADAVIVNAVQDI